MINLNEIRDFKRAATAKKSSLLKQLQEDYDNRRRSELMEIYFELTPSQSYGPKMEKFYIENRGFTKVPSKLDRGDCHTPDEEYIEYKVTYATEKNKFGYNFVQIRPWQNLAGYALETFSGKDGWIRFNLSKKDMMKILEEYAHLAHGCKSTNINSKKELALRGKMGDKLWQSLNDKHNPNLFCSEQPNGESK
jgi:hypothetical protein